MPQYTPTPFDPSVRFRTRTRAEARDQLTTHRHGHFVPTGRMRAIPAHHDVDVLFRGRNTVTESDAVLFRATVDGQVLYSFRAGTALEEAPADPTAAFLETVPDPTDGRSYSVVVHNMGGEARERRSNLKRDRYASRAWRLTVSNAFLMQWGFNTLTPGSRFIILFRETRPREELRWDRFLPVKLQTGENPALLFYSRDGEERYMRFLDASIVHLIRGLGLQGVIFWIGVEEVR